MKLEKEKKGKRIRRKKQNRHYSEFGESLQKQQTRIELYRYHTQEH